MPRSGAIAFVGRDEALTQLHQMLQGGDRIAITAVRGMGGVGKTELALQYGLKYGQAYPGGLCWLRSREDAGSQIVAFARSQLLLNPREDAELSEQIAYCWRYWQEGEVLVIFDDVGDYKAIEPFLPPVNPRFKVLLTTRLRLGGRIQELTLDILERSESLNLLRKLVKDGRIDADLTQAEWLCEWLGDLPLGLELVGRYLEQKTDVGLATLRKRLEEKRLDAKALEKAYPGMTAPLGVAEAFDVSWETLTLESQTLAGLLSRFALAPIPWSMVRACLPEWDEEDLEDRRDEMVSLHLLQRVGKDIYQLHQLLREFFAVKWQQLETASELDSAAYDAIVAEAKRSSENPRYSLWAETNLVMPHLSFLVERLEDTGSPESLAIGLSWLAFLYQSQGNYAEAELLYRRSREIWERQLGADHPRVAQSLNNLAELYKAEGKYAEAEPLYLRSLKITEGQLGADHPDVATFLNNLAHLYQLQGKYAEAEPLYLRSLEITERQLGADHPDVATFLNNLAHLYQLQGKYAEAEPLYLRSLKITEGQLGADHPDVATFLNNLAHLYQLQGKYAEAEPLYLRSLEITKGQLGADHPDVARSLNNLAYLHQLQGNYGEIVELLHLKSWEIRVRKLGADHPDVAQSVNNLALLYQSQGKYAEAEPLFQRALGILMATFGEDHPHTQSVAISLMMLSLQRETGMSKDALEQMMQNNPNAIIELLQQIKSNPTT
ncbi:tetratricopeptide repeat protein [Pseudanabaena sp. PCC 6802]|uniref:tetratricopeptide repeat protein n=1 Tax=Pseudanabaena sp. PCC 6802 TaxID=118173 RepID=UPI0003496DA4|nr:tetratricopeptide repeat protein [Pseudanabaena sp. PCC 6802]